MNRTILMALALALVAPLGAFADQNVLGIPDVNCQTPPDWRTHDYGPPATGYLVFNPTDGNAGCPSPPPVFDGDFEYANGGGWLIAQSGDGVSSGGIACWGVVGHHPVGGSVYVTDAVFPDVVFTVAADFSALAPPLTPDCGDGAIEPCPPPPSSLPPPVGPAVDTVNAILRGVLGTSCNPLDMSQACLNRCAVPFPPGSDGAYVVFVGPTTNGGPAGTPTGATQGHIFL